MSHFKFKKEKGASLYLAIVIMSILLATVLGLTTISISQIKLVRGMGDSVMAFGAADAGIEWALYQERKECRQPSCPSPPCEGSCSGLLEDTHHGFLNLDLDGTIPSGNCPDALSQDKDDACYKITKSIQGTIVILQSIGFYRQAVRGIEVGF